MKPDVVTTGERRVLFLTGGSRGIGAGVVTAAAASPTWPARPTGQCFA